MKFPKQENDWWRKRTTNACTWILNKTFWITVHTVSFRFWWWSAWNKNIFFLCWMICKLYTINNVDYYISVCVDSWNDSSDSHPFNLIDVNVKGGPETMLTHTFFLQKKIQVRSNWMVETVVLDSISSFILK